MKKKLLLSVRDLTKVYPVKKGFLKRSTPLYACDGVSLDIYEGETFGVVGESGSGKSTFGRTVLRLTEPTSGELYWYEGEKKRSLHDMAKKDLRLMRKQMQMIFQDPYSSLNPRMTALQIIGEGLLAHGLYKKGTESYRNRVLSTAEECGVPSYLLHRYPHQFSGGQRQRICIARALVLRPRLVVCDECVSALDVSVQAQIINLLLQLKEREKLTYLFISHDLAVVRYLADRIGVMYRGKLVEVAPKPALFASPLHPYTRILLASDPSAKSSFFQVQKREFHKTGQGCVFYSRCPMAKSVCSHQVPVLREVKKGRLCACHFAEESIKGKTD